MILRIGIWFEVCHVSYGGPSLVLTGTLLGFYQWAKENNIEILVLLNEPGDVNWCLSSIDENNAHKLQNLWCGPIIYNHADVENDYKTSPIWNNNKNILFPSTWYANMICTSMPYNDPLKADGRRYAVWPSGVDTDFFCPPPALQEKTMDYFIYFKSQTPADLQVINEYLFSNWFGIKGSVLTYYFYDKEMLRNTARSSKFCIMLDNTETQGLAALEIMATGCPLFVCDCTNYSNNGVNYPATSVTNMDNTCGMKSSLAKLKDDFPIFIDNLKNYKPRDFVVSNYSFKCAAGRLLTLIMRRD